MNTKHTPGTWEDCDRDTCRMIYAKGYEQHICIVDSYSKGFGPDRAERDANARLIAAAPDLLDAAMMAVENAVADNFDEWYVALKAAIAKATGEPQ